MLRSIVSVRPTFAAIFKYDLRMAFQPMPLSRRGIFRTEVRRVPLIRRHPKWAICCTRRTTRAWTAAVAVRGRLPL